MDGQKFTDFLNKSFESVGEFKGWFAQNNSGVVFIFDNKNEFLASASFYANPTLFEFSDAGLAHKHPILTLWDEYQKRSDPAGGPGKGILNSDYSTASIVLIAIILFVCIAAPIGGLLLGYLLFGG